MATGNGGAVAAETNVFVLSEVYFTITKYQFNDSSYYNIVNKYEIFGENTNLSKRGMVPKGN